MSLHGRINAQPREAEAVVRNHLSRALAKESLLSWNMGLRFGESPLIVLSVFNLID